MAVALAPAPLLVSRAEPAYRRAAEMLASLGPIAKLDLVADLPLSPESKCARSL